MQQVYTPVQANTDRLTDGAGIPALTPAEAASMAEEELKRFLALLETLADADWSQPTACILWTVKDIAAHQSAHVYGFTSRRAFFSQLSPRKLRLYLKQGFNLLDAWNQSQVDLRRDLSPAELIAEIRHHASDSLRNRSRIIPGLLRDIPLPLPGLDQPRSLAYVIDLIYTRDMWMHRADICTATGRTMDMDGTYDARQVALIIRDLAQKAVHGLGGYSAELTISGAPGGSFRIGSGAAPEAVVAMDAITLGELTSGRAKAAELLSSGRISQSGDLELARQVVKFMENRVLF
ncbi:maleylpyruvate isomerase family mycothiol-dependent enzyme [Geitlerinema splendidum]|jgi:uncharacterized protein (TIGR03083 family)|nr:maleylpyruvate isomerase family mycothiol-dependent enzyme [Geitlerinema splendidum]